MRTSSNTLGPTLGHTEVCQWVCLVLFLLKDPFLCLSTFHEPQFILSSEVPCLIHFSVFITCSVPVYSFWLHPSKSWAHENETLFFFVALPFSSMLMIPLWTSQSLFNPASFWLIPTVSMILGILEKICFLNNVHVYMLNHHSVKAEYLMRFFLLILLIVLSLIW